MTPAHIAEVAARRTHDRRVRNEALAAAFADEYAIARAMTLHPYRPTTHRDPHTH